MVRTALASDIEVLLAMGQAMHRESPRFALIPFVEAKARVMIGYLLETGGAFVAEVDGEIVGMLAGFCVEHFFSTTKYVADIVVYVVPQYRGGTAAVRLVRALEKWAREMRATEVVLGVSTEVDTERTAMLYQHLGYRETGRSLIKHV